jgi:hypothetical protein
MKKVAAYAALAAFLCAATLLVTSLREAHEREQQKWAVADNLHGIGLGLAMYRSDHHGQYPPDLSVVVNAEYLGSTDLLLDSSDTQPVPVGPKGVKCSYEYVGPIPMSTPHETIIAYTRKGIYPGERIVLYEDLAVAWGVTEADLHDPNKPARESLVASYKGLVAAWGGELTAEQSARLK